MFKVTVKSGDTLSKLAHRYLGYPAGWTEIWEQNKASLKSGDPNLIYPGEVIYITPKNDGVEAPSTPSEENLPGNIYPQATAKTSKLYAEINGKRYTQWQSISLSTSLESLQWSANLNGVFSNTDPGIIPFGNEKIKIYVDDVLLYTGFTDTVFQDMDEQGIAMRASSSSFGFLADDHFPSGEIHENETAISLIKKITSPYNINVQSKTTKATEQVAKLEITPGETRLEKIEEVANIMDMLVLPNSSGGIILTNLRSPVTILDINSRTIGAPKINLESDIRLLKSHIICRRTSAEGTVEKGIATSDERRNVTRVINADEIYDLKTHAQKMMKKQKAMSIKIGVSLSSIINADGQVYLPGAGIKLSTPMWQRDDELIISSVSYTQDKSGVRCQLQVKPLEAFS